MNIDSDEIRKFSRLAGAWWDPDGDMRALHDINPVRCQYVLARAALPGARVLDVGCGGGILTESLAQAGALATGIDGSEELIEVARSHAKAAAVGADYQCTTLEQLSVAAGEEFDVITCMELLEHVPDPAALIERASRLLRAGGHLFVATINRTPAAYCLAVLGAEYVLKLLPRGTHDYERFIRPSEMGRWMRACGLVVRDLTGLYYNPLTRAARTGPKVTVNYMMHAQADAA